MSDVEENWNLIGYARVSTDDQELGLQLTALRNAGVREEYIFKEHVSGVSPNRPQLEKAMKYLRPGDTLVVWKLDRLGRSVEELIRVMNSFNESGIQLRSLTEGIDSTTALGNFFFLIMAALAQFERDLISERTKAGIEEAKKRGTFKSRPPTISREQWDFMVEALKLNPFLSPGSLEKMKEMPIRKGKPPKPKRTTINNYMDRLKSHQPYPPEWHVHEKK